MTILQITFLFISIFAISNAFFVPPTINDAGFGDHFFNQKLNYLEDKFKGTPVDFDAIKEKIEAKKRAEIEEQIGASEDSVPTNLWLHKWLLLQNKLRGNAELVRQKLEAKQSDDLCHHVSKRSAKNNGEDEDEEFGAAIGNYFLNQKLTFLGNKFKDSPIDFDAIKQKIEAKKEAKRQEEIANAASAQDQPGDEKLTLLLGFLKRLHAEKLNVGHQIAKRSVKEEEDPAVGAAIGNHFFNQKLTFLENKFKGSLVDFDAIKEKIEAKKEAKRLEEAEKAAASQKGKNPSDKLLLLESFLKQLTADQLAGIIGRLEGKHSVTKRAVGPATIGGPQYGAAMRDHFLKQKFDFLNSKDFQAFKQKKQPRQ